MNVLNKDEFLNKGLVMPRRLREQVFIYPTDTIYGIGCDATNDLMVDKVRDIKDRFDMPFSVIAPSLKWIKDNCEVNDKAKEWMEKLPGPYTLIMKLKNKSAVSESVTLGKETIGVRMPDNWFMDVVKQMKIPIVTTSANVTGEDFMTCVDDMSKEIGNKVDIIIHDGVLQGRPSTLVFLHKDNIELKTR